MSEVTKESIDALVEIYRSYVRDPSQGKLIMQLSKGIITQLSKVGGSWLPDETNYRKSFFEGLTKLCWHFSTNKGVDAATAYRSFVDKNYNLWYHMSNKDKKTFGAECHEVTDGLADWTAITKDLSPRSTICHTALEVTTGMFDQSSSEVEKSTKLWNNRMIP